MINKAGTVAHRKSRSTTGLAIFPDANQNARAHPISSPSQWVSVRK